MPLRQSLSWSDNFIRVVTVAQLPSVQRLSRTSITLDAGTSPIELTSSLAALDRVVDGTRRKTDRKQFQTALKDGLKHQTRDGLVQQIWIHDSRLLKEWVHVGVIVAFDFGKDTVWDLRRTRDDWVYGFEYPKLKLIEHISESLPIPDVLFGKP